MLLSMTGYGRATHTFKEKTLTVEMRSLNSKHTDVRFKIPQNYKEKEGEMRRLLIQKLERGKIDVSIEVQSMQGDDEYNLNIPLFKKYYQELSNLADELGIPQGDIIQSILRLPNIVAATEEGVDEAEWQAILEALDKATKQFIRFREKEGAAMEKDLQMRIDNIQAALSKLDPFEKERVDKLRQRLHQSLEEYLGKENIDENRFEQEILFYLEKMDITEEKVRLEQHCKYFLEVMGKPKTLKGRKLNFISQEMGREINTMGAKAYSSEIQRLVVAMKDDLEKIKEQIANSV